jgi:hypothetical protein
MRRMIEPLPASATTSVPSLKAVPCIKLSNASPTLWKSPGGGGVGAGGGGLGGAGGLAGEGGEGEAGGGGKGGGGDGFGGLRGLGDGGGHLLSATFSAVSAS